MEVVIAGDVLDRKPSLVEELNHLNGELVFVFFVYFKIKTYITLTIQLTLPRRTEEGADVCQGIRICYLIEKFIFTYNMFLQAHNRELEEELLKRRGAEEEVKDLMNKCAEMTNAAVKVKV